jgi:hypothetical protein
MEFGLEKHSVPGPILFVYTIDELLGNVWNNIEIMQKVLSILFYVHTCLED